MVYKLYYEIQENGIKTELQGKKHGLKPLKLIEPDDKNISKKKNTIK